MTWFSLVDLAALLPVIALAAGAIAVLIVDASLKGEGAKAALGYIAVGSIVAAIVAVLAAWGQPVLRGGGSMRLGAFPQFISLVVLTAGGMVMLYSSGYARDLGIEIGEYYGLLLFALAGMVYLSAANDLVTAYLAFELMSLSVYALVAIHRANPRGYEGALKYFIMGAFASAFLLFGMALLYGATGTIYLDQMRWVGAAGTHGLVLAAVGLLLTGFAFKVGAVPFHAWVPDAYQGAPASITGFMAVAVKAAAFGILIRVLVGLGFLVPPGPDEIAALLGPGADAVVQTDAVTGALWVLAFVTMLVGNTIALAQTNLKRLLAYSGIAHSGYVLVGLTAATRTEGQDGISGALFYLASYAAMTLAVFCVLTALRQRGRDLKKITDLTGLAKERPVEALCLTIALLSLVGMPPTAGFMGKLLIFRSAVAAGFPGLVVLACLATAISVYYYLRPIVLMYTGEPVGLEDTEVSFGARSALWITTAATILIGVMPKSVLALAAASLASL